MVLPRCLTGKTGFTTRAGFNMVKLSERSGLTNRHRAWLCARVPIDAGERSVQRSCNVLLDWAYRNYSYVEKTPANTV